MATRSAPVKGGTFTLANDRIAFVAWILTLPEGRTLVVACTCTLPEGRAPVTDCILTLPEERTPGVERFSMLPKNRTLVPALGSMHAKPMALVANGIATVPLRSGSVSRRISSISRCTGLFPGEL